MTKEEREQIKSRFKLLGKLTEECNRCGDCDNCLESMGLESAMEEVHFIEAAIQQREANKWARRPPNLSQ